MRKKVGLALGSGAARGLAHIGVLEVLEREGIPVDMIAGTSAGALIGALYAQGKSISQIKELSADVGWKRLVPLVDIALPRTGFIGGRRVKDMVRSIIGDIRFEDLQIPFSCVAADIMTGEEVVINRGSVVEGVRASISIPVIFTVVKQKGRYLVDGGLVDPVPVSVVRQMGADFVIAVNVVPDVKERSHWVDKEGKEGAKDPHIFSIMMQSIYISSYSLVESSLEGANIVIEPQMAHIGAGDFHRAQECISRGELAAQDAIPEIKRKLQA
ncbi:MAG: patatin-like phospholipase family protein [Dehalococcoidales bacterium]|nr:patatin-like phospholipase family protein [Dehalococcoidales bacterium]